MDLRKELSNFQFIEESNSMMARLELLYAGRHKGSYRIYTAAKLTYGLSELYCIN